MNAANDDRFRDVVAELEIPNKELVNGLDTYLKAVDSISRSSHQGEWAWATYQRMILVHGVAGFKDKGPQLPDTYPVGDVGECFGNAAQLAWAHPELTYVEGYAGSLVPVEHAWCITKAGKIIDNTWTGAMFDERASAYMGIQYTTKFLTELLTEQKIFGILSSDWRNGNRALVKGYRFEKGVAVGWQ